MRTLRAKSADPACLAKEIVSNIPLEDICQDQELMNAFLAEMFLAIAKASTKEHRRQRQAEGIAAAKARGVKFGPKAPPLPDNFDEIRIAWRRGEFSITKAAELCGMAKTTFYNAVQRAEEAEEAASVGEDAGGADNPVRYHQGGASAGQAV